MNITQLIRDNLKPFVGKRVRATLTNGSVVIGHFENFGEGSFTLKYATFEKNMFAGTNYPLGVEVAVLPRDVTEIEEIP